MHIEKHSNASSSLDHAFFLFGTALLIFLHFFALSEVPGLHFDEAWAMNYSWRIASEPGFYPLSAMSPYTAPWAHYWAAFWMKLMGPSVAVFRASQAMLALIGLGFIWASLFQRGYRSAAFLLPLLAALLPALILNHRFAIELNGFHVFCFGLFLWAAVSKRPLLLAFAWILGTTSHILFYGVGIGFLGALIWEGRSLRERDRWIAILSSLLLLLFFTKVMLLIPEKGKAAGLMASTFVMVAFLLFRAEQWPFWRRTRWETLAIILSAVFLFNGFFFLQGSWSVGISTGGMLWKGWFGVLGLTLFFSLILYLLYSGKQKLPRWSKRWLLLSVIVMGAMMLKPAPRYYEIVFLAFLVVGAVGLSAIPSWAKVGALLLLFLHGTWIYSFYFTTMPREESLRFLFFKDSSRDFLSKQTLASVLGGWGCRLSDINSVDYRVNEALAAIAREDWPVEGSSCRWKKGVQVSRRVEAVRTGAQEEFADFYLWQVE